FPTDDTGKALGEFRLNVSGSGYSIIYEDRQIAVRPCKGTRSGSYSLNDPDDKQYFKN
ncbi:MAG: hypothetical protein HY831_04310, partial [Candidatus Aenigmarchaeota archaeon]|nr:hypothetical protein [Candidatus Aenigmarchaeota archaeon]